MSGRAERNHAQSGASAPYRERHADRGANRRQTETFAECVPQNRRGSAGAERGPHRELVRTSSESREDEVADIRASDEQHECDRCQEECQRRAQIADERLLERLDVDANAFVAFRIRHFQRPRRRLEIGTHLCEIDAGPEAANHAHGVHVPGREHLVVVLSDRQKHIGVQARDDADANVRRYDADDRVRLAIERHGFSDDCGSAAKARRQRFSPSRATGGPPMRSSVAVNVRPRSGCVRRIEK